MTENFVKKFVAKYGRGPATFAGNGYDSMMMLAAAIGRAGSTDSAAIRDAFEQTTNYPGVTSVYTYSAMDHYGAQRKASRCTRSRMAGCGCSRSSRPANLQR